MKKLITFLLCTALFAVTANAATYYVNTSLVTGANNGSSWTDAFKTFDAAIAASFTSDATVDNVYIKGAISKSNAWNMSIDNYYGSFEGWESSPTQRPMNDNDGNGIIELWEFKYPATFTSTNNATAINGSAAILDGFTITHKGTVSGSTSMTTLISPTGQTVQNCVFYGSNLTYSAYTNHNGGCVLKVLGTFQNNLVEKNNVTITYGNTTDIKIAPILDINFPSSGTISAKVIGCIFRNNNASITNSTLTAAAPANIRGMILNVTQTTTSGSATVTFSDCIVHNNTASYTGNGTYLTASSAAIVSCLTFSGSNTNDAMINCTFANNSTTNMANACYFVTSSGTGVYHKVYNNVFWNNSNSGTNKSIQSQSAQNANTVFDNNYLDLVTGGSFGGTTWGANNVTNLSQSNTGNNSPLFKNPPIKASVNFIGSALATSDSTIIKQADWRITAIGSYLYHKGAATATTSITTDKSGISFYSSNPTVGAYEFTGNQAITFSPFNPNKTYGDVTFTLAASGGPSGSAVTFSSSDATIASVSGSIVTILKPGTCNLLANQAAGGSFTAATQVSQSLTVGAKGLTITSPAVTDKVYDGTTAVVITGTLSGVINSDDVSLVGIGNTLGSNVGTNKTVTAACTLNGTKAPYYSLSQPTGLNAIFTAKPLTIGAPSIASKVYDGSATSGTVTPGALSGLVGSQNVYVSAATGTFGDANVGTVKSATIVYTLADGPTSGLATNYSLANGSANGDITAASGSPTSDNLNNSGLTDNQLANTNLTISSGEFIINATKTVRSLTIAPGAKLTHSSGTLTTTSGITLESDATGTATIMDSYTEPTITATVKQYVTAGRNWYMSAPLNNTADYSALDKGASVAEYNEVTGLWPAVTNGTLTRGKGYVQVASASQGTTGTVSFSGTTNSGNVPVTLTYTSGKGNGYNLVGNPYPSYLSWSAVAADNTAANMPTGTMWYRTISYNGKNAWTPNTVYSLNDIVYNGTRFYKATSVTGTSDASGGPTGGLTGITDGSVVWNYEGSIYLFATISASGVASPATVSNLVPPMQAFWVKSTGGTLTFKNAMRSHNSGGTNALKAPKALTTDIKLLRLNVSNGVSADEAVIYASADASNAFDTYDAPKYFNTAGSNQPEIYTQVGSEKLVINAMNELSHGTEIPLGFATEKGNNFTISATELKNISTDIQVVLKDKQLNREFDLSTSNVYEFSSDVANDTNRFSLLFKSKGTTSGLNNVEKLNAQVFVNANNQITIIASDKATCKIYNAVGQLVSSVKSITNRTIVNSIRQAGVYVVKLTENGNELTTKVIIK
jgi:hypothetical protein